MLINLSALEQCLNEVTKCDLFVGVLGARYGWIPTKEQLLHAIKRNPALGWLDDPKILGSELSVTALEVMAYLKQFGSERALFFFRQADYRLACVSCLSAVVLIARTKWERAPLSCPSVRSALYLVKTSQKLRRVFAI